MEIKKLDTVPLEPVTMEGASGASVRVVFGPKDNAPTFAMRIFELAPGGHTPFHDHPFEHEALILEGCIALVTLDGRIELAPDHAVLVPPDEPHQFKNLSDTNSAKFMCLVPIQYQK